MQFSPGANNNNNNNNVKCSTEELSFDFKRLLQIMPKQLKADS